MHSPRPTVSATKQAFDALRGAKAKRTFYGSVPAQASARAAAALRVTGARVSDGAVVIPRCVSRSR